MVLTEAVDHISREVESLAAQMPEGLILEDPALSRVSTGLNSRGRLSAQGGIQSFELLLGFHI